MSNFYIKIFYIKFPNNLLALCGRILSDKLKFQSWGIKRAGFILQTFLLFHDVPQMWELGGNISF